MRVTCTPNAKANTPKAIRPKYCLLRSIEESEPLDDFAPVLWEEDSESASRGWKSRLRTEDDGVGDWDLDGGEEGGGGGGCEAMHRIV